MILSDKKLFSKKRGNNFVNSKKSSTFACFLAECIVLWRIPHSRNKGLQVINLIKYVRKIKKMYKEDIDKFLVRTYFSCCALGRSVAREFWKGI